MTPTRQKAKPVFDPAALDQDLDDLWPTPKPAAHTAGTRRETASDVQPHSPPPRPAQSVAPTATPATPAAPAAKAVIAPGSAEQPSAARDGGPTDQTAETTTRSSNERKKFRPPEVLLSSEVYDELYRVQIAEKKIRRGLARTMGAIVLDAIEAHAKLLETTWSHVQFAVGEGQLFERPSSNAVPRRRRHATAPRTVVLSGVTAANSQRLDNLVQVWGAGTRSALVEQALRYEFDLMPASR